jgi:hypothetical protein
MTETSQQEIFRAKVNLETSRIAWKELQRFFASGAAVWLSKELDLVEVAFQLSEDNKTQVSAWMAAGKLAGVTDEQARIWYEQDADVWAVVISPFVLIQEV